MWLLPVLSTLTSAVTRTFSRLERAGGSVPRTGPVLVVANHNNSLLDPALLATAARRPVRFLAKAPLFSDRMLGWLVRGAGAIPIYRRRDDPTLTSRNLDSFAAAQAALARGDAVGIFPEGLSHDEPSLSPLKTGAARIALGAASLGRPPAIVPIGLVFRQKESFRSEALVVVGEPVEWRDLAGGGDDEARRMRELTSRIEHALRGVTINLETWEDAPLVLCAEAVWAAEHQTSAEPADRIARLRAVTETLARLRREGGGRWELIARDLSRHERLLRRLGMQPAELHTDARLSTAVRWSVRQLPYAAVAGWLVAAIGTILWWLPYRATGWFVDVDARGDSTSTNKALYGTVLMLGWYVALLAAAGAAAGWIAALATAVLAPAAGLATLALQDRWRDAWGDARRFLLRRRRRDLIEALRERQRELARRLDELYAAWQPAVQRGRDGEDARGSASGRSATT